MIARTAGHMFLHESAAFPPFGVRWLPPFGSAPYGSGSASLRETFGFTCSAPQKTKASLTTFAHTKAFILSVCSHALAQKTKTKDKALHKGMFYVALRPMYRPLRGQCHWAYAGKCTRTTSALHKSVFHDRACSLRSHKSVLNDRMLTAFAQKRVL